jgi:methionyl-tRNA synthetase
VCGSDDGVAISMKAKKKGLHRVIDKYDGIIRKSFIDFDIDNYSRTSAKIHHDTSEFFTTLYEKVIL